MSTEQDLLSTALADRAERLDVHGPTMSDVVGEARTIRRKRRVATGVATFAALAVLAPGGAWIASQMPGSDAGPDPTETPSQVPDPDPASMGVSVYDSATGTVQAPDGGEVSVDLAGDAMRFAELPDGRLVFLTYDETRATKSDPDGFQVELVDADGRTTTYRSLSSSLALNGAGTAVTWVGPGGEPTVAQSGVTEPVELTAIEAAAGAGAEPQPVHIGGEDCSTNAETRAGGGCHVVVGVHDPQSGEATAWSSSTHGIVDRYGPLEGYRVWDVSPDGERLLQQSTKLDFDNCHRHVRVDDKGPEAETCVYGHFAYSPDGTHLRAYDANTDGYGPSAVFVLDAETLEPVVTVDADGHTYLDSVWEDAEHLVSLVDNGDGRIELQRIGLDGSMDVIRDLGPVEDQNPTFTLEARP